MICERNMNDGRKLCYLPTGSHPFIQPKIEQSKYKQKYQDLTIPVLLLFIFRFFTHSPICLNRSPFSCFLSVFKGRKSKTGRKAENENTRKQRIYKENSNPTPIHANFNLFLFLPFIGTVSNDVADLKPEKEQRTKQKKSNLKV